MPERIKGPDSSSGSGSSTRLNLGDLSRAASEYHSPRGEKNPIFIEHIKNGGREALIVANTPLAIKRASRWYYEYDGDVDYGELVQEGVLGLVYTLEKFNPKAKNQFSTYAVRWIDSYIRRHAQKEFRQPRTSLDQPLNHGKVTLGEVLDTDDETAEEEIFDNQILGQIKKLLDTDLLTEKQSKAIRMRYFGIKGKYFTLEEIGLELECTKTRAGELCEIAEKKIRNYLLSGENSPE